MNKRLINEGFNNYYIIDMETEFKENYEVNMLLQNRFEYLLEFGLKLVDGNTVYEYKISGYQPLSRMLKTKKLNYEKIKKITEGILMCYEEVEDYLLCVNNLLINIDDIFVNPNGFQLKFCYAINANRVPKEQYLELIEDLMKVLDYQDHQGMEYVYQIYDEMKKEDFSFDRFKNQGKVSKENKICTQYKEPSESIHFQERILEKENSGCEKEKSLGSYRYKKKDNIEKKKIKKWIRVSYLGAIVVDGLSLAVVIYRIVTEIALQSDYKLGVVLMIILGVLIFLLISEDDVDKNAENSIEEYIHGEKEQEDNSKENQREEVEKAASFFDKIEQESTSLGKTETTVLSTLPKESKPMLYALGKGAEHIILFADSLVLGSSEMDCDCKISQKGISRIHANIYNQLDKWYITDLDSTNGTFVNGTRVGKGLTVGLDEGDTVALGETEYCLRFN